MKKVIYSWILFIAIFISSCQGDGELGEVGYCYFAVTFNITQNQCPVGGSQGFTIRFIDEEDNQYDFSYLLPEEANDYKLIDLPSGHTYSAYVLNGSDEGCFGASIYFDINIHDLDKEEICGVISTSIDERPTPCCVNPEAVFTFEEECNGCPVITIKDPVIPPPIIEECCFNYSFTPKWFPDCFTECSGNWDNVIEIQHRVCEKTPLPAGFTSAITGMTINNSTATFGNCFDCDNPITTLPNPSLGVNAGNIAVCGYGFHSVLIEVTIYDQNGAPFRVCEEDYYSFLIDNCSW